jgi:hypothetical protein
MTNTTTFCSQFTWFEILDILFVEEHVSNCGSFSVNLKKTQMKIVIISIKLRL